MFGLLSQPGRKNITLALNSAQPLHPSSWQVKYKCSSCRYIPHRHQLCSYKNCNFKQQHGIFVTNMFNAQLIETFSICLKKRKQHEKNWVLSVRHGKESLQQHLPQSWWIFHLGPFTLFSSSLALSPPHPQVTALGLISLIFKNIIKCPMDAVAFSLFDWLYGIRWTLLFTSHRTL